MKKALIPTLIVLILAGVAIFTAFRGLHLGSKTLPSAKSGIEFDLDIVGGTQLVFEAQIPEGTSEADVKAGMQTLKTMLERRLVKYGYTRATLKQVGDDSFLVDLPRADDIGDLAQKLDGKGWFLSSANSINWGRLLPQVVYYFSAYCDYVNSGKIKMGDRIDFCVPTGNFGDILAGWYAKQMGLPVRKLICASNKNRVLTDFFETGVYDRKREFYTTISPSMDILVSSNLERLLYMLAGEEKVKLWMEQLKTAGKYDVGSDILAKLRADFDCGCADDDEAKAAISRLYKEKDYLMDTHTADAFAVLEKRRAAGERFPTVVVSTASPFKFCDAVLSALGEQDAVSDAALIDRLTEKTGRSAPKPLTGLGSRPVRFTGSTKKEQLPEVVMDFLRK